MSKKLEKKESILLSLEKCPKKLILTSKKYRLPCISGRLTSNLKIT